MLNTATISERHLHVEAWVVAAIALFVVGDSVTTAIALEMGASEQHPVARAVLSMGGTAGMVVYKCAITAIFIGLSKTVPASWRVGVPIGLSILGAALTVWNGWVIVRLVGL